MSIIFIASGTQDNSIPTTVQSILECTEYLDATAITIFSYVMIIY